jgi:hypothetical protein
MSDVAKLGQGLHLSISTLAAEFGMTRETVSKRLADASSVPSGKRGGYPVYRLKDVYPYLVGAQIAAGEDPQNLDPYRRQAHYKAELDRLKLEQETRELIPRLEVEQEQARILRVVAQTLDTLPDVVERDCGASAAQIQRLERAIDECREALYTELADDGIRDSA